MRLEPLALGALICAGAGATAFAQQQPPQTNERQFSGAISVQGVYESNFARSGSALAAQRGIQPEEYILRPQATLLVVQPFGQQAVYVQGGGGYDFHRNNARLDRHRYDVTTGYQARLGICQAGAVGTYRASQSDLALIDTTDTKNLNRSTTTGLSLICGRATGFGFATTAQRTDIKNSNTVQKPADSTAESLQTVLTYSHPTLGTLGIVYSYANNELPNVINPSRPVGDGFWTQSFGLSVERNFGSRLRVSAMAAETRVKREFAPAGTDQKFKSTTYSGDLSYRFGDRLVLELQGERSVRPAGRAGKLYDIDTGGQIQARYRFGTRYTASLGYGIADIESNFDTVGTRPVVTDARTNSVFGSIRYRQSDRASVGLDVRHDERSTNLPDFNYSSTRVGISAEIGF